MNLLKNYDKFENLCHRKWVENIGISEGIRTFYFDLLSDVSAHLSTERKSHEDFTKEFEEKVNKIESGSSDYDVCYLPREIEDEIYKSELKLLENEDKLLLEEFYNLISKLRNTEDMNIGSIIKFINFLNETTYKDNNIYLDINDFKIKQVSDDKEIFVF